MIRAIIIDDERDARFLLSNLLHKNFSNIVQIVGEADDVNSGIREIEQKKPDLVFLDIRLSSGSGFDLLKRIKNIDFEIIFVTAYDNYAVEAFQFSAFGYLLKTIKKKDLEEIIVKLQKHIERQKKGAEQRLNILVENYGKDGEITKLVIPDLEGFKVLTVANIIRLEGDRNYTHFILQGEKKIVSSKNLGTYEDMLNPFGFIRIHQSSLINLRHVKGYVKGDGGKVEMSDGELVQVSRHKKAYFMERFMQ